jgi:hypothetical protein
VAKNNLLLLPTAADVAEAQVINRKQQKHTCVFLAAAAAAEEVEAHTHTNCF